MIAARVRDLLFDMLLTKRGARRYYFNLNYYEQFRKSRVAPASFPAFPRASQRVGAGWGFPQNATGPGPVFQSHQKEGVAKFGSFGGGKTKSAPGEGSGFCVRLGGLSQERAGVVETQGL